ncbi:FliH/SctL family protein [Novosphingobium sp.]|uniref:FliH/SctL family protein n=1 Tax=Novosphingobium sp. TaxID=1874826 RepID=UPI00286DA658|nr:FliH/SctL family protein [Novosphingobium sp.]
MSSLAALSSLPQETGFREDLRYGASAEARAQAYHAPSEPVEPPQDPIEVAFAEGYAAGLEASAADAAARIAADDAARGKLGLSLARLDGEMAEDLRQRFVDTVIALCEATLVPFAVDETALATRVSRAVAMLSRADDERVIRLNPEDLKLVAGKLDEQWNVQPDPALPRGELRVESANGGVEDGPAQWRRALIEAFEAC